MLACTWKVPRVELVQVNVGGDGGGEGQIGAFPEEVFVHQLLVRRAEPETRRQVEDAAAVHLSFLPSFLSLKSEVCSVSLSVFPPLSLSLSLSLICSERRRRQEAYIYHREPVEPLLATWTSILVCLPIWPCTRGLSRRQPGIKLARTLLTQRKKYLEE